MAKVTAKDFRRGDITFQLKEVERIYLLSLFKKAQPKTDLEKRIVKRALAKLMGHRTYWIPLYPNKECKICDREIRGDRYDEHVERCKKKQEAERRLPPIDPAVLEMMNTGL